MGTDAAKRNALTPVGQLRGFLAKYEPAVAADARRALAKVRTLVPGALELVYDNYNALVIGFGPSERASEAVISLAIFPKWVTLCFIQHGPDIPDPTQLLKGSGNVVRHTRLTSAADLDKPAIKALIQEALKLADVPIKKTGTRRTIIKSVSAKQRPRRP
jgi:hypothetical protein